MRNLILRLIHYVISLGEILIHFLRWLPSQGLALKAKNVHNFQADSRRISKIPVHVGIVIVEDEYHFRDLANLIVWCVTLGISYITVYDVNGEVKRNSLILERFVEASKEEMLGCDNSVCDIQICSTVDPGAQILPGQTGSSKRRQASVWLLCVEDGQENVVSMAQRVSQLVQSGMYKVDNIKPENINAMFSENMHFPDPDLCLKFGSIESTCGYLPWQIRLTEIISYPSHKNLSYKSFMSFLFQFSKVNQRFGI